jgi:hypothetical protein
VARYIPEHSAQPPWETQAGRALPQHRIKLVNEQIGQQSGRHVGPADGEPEHQREQQQHDGESPHTAGDNAVYRAVHGWLGSRAGPCDSARSEACGLGVNGFDEVLMKIAGNFLTPALGFTKDFFRVRR